MDNLTTKYTDILSESFQNLKEIALKEKENYLNAKPFPNIVLKDFFNNSFLTSILNEFPDLSKINETQKYKHINNKVFVRSKADKRRKAAKIKNVYNISSVTGVGVGVLLRKTKQILIKNQKNEPMFSRERHTNIMKNVLKTLSSIDFNQSLDIISLEYRSALRQSLEINQNFDIEKILDIIFKDFCIGK